MALIGILFVLVSFYAVYRFVFTGRRAYVCILLYSLPMIGMIYTKQGRSNINGITVLMSIFVICADIYSLYDTALWYKAEKNKYKFIDFAVIFIIFILSFYYTYQCLAGGYLNFLGTDIFNKYAVYVAVVCSVFYTASARYILYTAVDKYFSQNEKFIIIKCSPVRKNGIIKMRGINGVQNGINYFFNADRRTFFLLRNEKRLVLDVKKGVHGGMYVSQKGLFNKTFDRRNKRIVRRLNQKAGISVLFLLLIVLLMLKLKMNMNFSDIFIVIFKDLTGLKN